MFPLALISSITLTGILIYCGVTVFFLHLIIRRGEYFDGLKHYPWHFSAFLFYIFAFSLAKLVNSGLMSGLNSFFSTCQNYFVFLWAYYFIFFNFRKSNLIRAFLIVSACVSVFYGMMQFFHLDVLNRQVVLNRLSGFHKNPYTYSGQLIVFFFFLVTCFLNEHSQFKKYMFLTISVFCFFCVLNASERAVIFGVIISFIVYLFLRGTKKDLKYLFSILLIPLVVTWYLNKKLFQRIKNVFKSQKENVRLKLWNIAIAVWKRHILFGVGKFPTIYQETDNSMHVLVHAHNVYLQILVTHGLLGLLAFLNLFFNFLKIVLKNINKNPYSLCLLAILIAYFIEGFFEHFWGDSEVRYLFLYFAGYICGMLDFNSKKGYN